MSIHAAKVGIWVSDCKNFPGNYPPYETIAASDLGFSLCYVNAIAEEDPFVTPELIRQIASKGLLPCVWFVPRTGNAAREAKKVSDAIAALEKPDANGKITRVAAVMLDVETHDLNFQRGLLRAYRLLRPGRATDWTFEPRQSILTVIAHELVAARMTLFPQMYRDNMRDADPYHELKYWSKIVGWDNVRLFLDAKTDWWALESGLLFSAERLG